MKRFFELLVNVVFNNKKACDLIQEGTYYRLVFIPILLRWLLTWIATLCAFLLGRVPFVEPFVNIPLADYYFYELFFLVPYGLALWVIVTGSTQIMVNFFNPKSDFKETLVYFSFVDLALWPTYGIIDFITIFTNTWISTLLIPVHTLAALLGLLMYARGIRHLHGLRPLIAFLIGFIATILYRPLAVILIR